MYQFSLEDGLPDDSIRSKWSILAKECKDRRNMKWIKRFADKLTPNDIVPEPLSLIEERWNRIENSGWKNVTIGLDKLSPPKLLQKSAVADMHHVADDGPCSGAAPGAALRSLYCYKCWKIVSAGVTRVNCSSCTLVAHQSCVSPPAFPSVDFNVWTRPTTPSSSLAENVRLILDFEPIETCHLPSERLQFQMKLLDQGEPKKIILDSIIFNELNNKSDENLYFQVLKTFLYK